VTLKPHTHNQSRAWCKNHTAVAYYISTSVDGKERTPSSGEGRPGTRHFGTAQRQQGRETCRVVDRGGCEVTIVELVGCSRECHYPSPQHMSNSKDRGASLRSLRPLPQSSKNCHRVSGTREEKERDVVHGFRRTVLDCKEMSQVASIWRLAQAQTNGRYKQRMRERRMQIG
jgi:hypothetical protein